jgi:DNA-binding transcriptional ArsR family regulator
VSESSKKAQGGDFRLRVDPSLVSALSHPLRVHILDALAEAAASPSDIAREVGLSVNYVAYHVNELQKLGYLELVKTEPRRGTVEHYYRAKRLFLLDDSEWERLPKPVKAGFNVEIFGSIIADVKEALEADTFDSRNAHLSRTRLRVDERGWDELMNLLERTLHRILDLKAECAERLEASGEEAIPVAVSIVNFETPARPKPDAPSGD